MFQLGERHYFAVSRKFNGKVSIHIRKFYDKNNIEGCNSQKIPTKFGVALTVEEWFDLLRIAPLLNEDITEYQRQVQSNYLPDYSVMRR